MGDMNTYDTLIETPIGKFRVSIEALPEEAPPKRPERMRWPKTTRMRLLHAQDFRCALCMGPLGFYDSHIDHVVPLAAGGEDALSNLQLTHGSCNLRKGGRDPRQERMPWA